MRNLHSPNTSTPSADTPADYKKKSYSIRNLQVANETQEDDSADFKSVMAELKQNSLPLCPLVVKEEEEDEEEPTENTTTTSETSLSEPSSVLTQPRKPLTLRQTLQQIDARLSTLLDSMHETRRKIHAIQYEDKSDDLLAETAHSKVLVDVEEDFEALWEDAEEWINSNQI